jgi:hypothetical protein
MVQIVTLILDFLPRNIRLETVFTSHVLMIGGAQDVVFLPT